MNKKEISKFGYDYAYDCGKETYTPDVLDLMHNLLCESNPNFKAQYKKSNIFYLHGSYGDLCLNPFKQGSKQYKYFTEGVLKASKEMVVHNGANQNISFEDWSFDGDTDAACICSNAVKFIIDAKQKKKCQVLLKKYEDGISSAIELANILSKIVNSRYTIFNLMPKKSPCFSWGMNLAK
jgi:hypothetical protein